MLAFLGSNASDRKLRQFAVACCRRLWHLLVDERSCKAVEVAEGFADGSATDRELESERQAAWEFPLHEVWENESLDLSADALNAADAPACAAEWPVEPFRVVIAAQRALGPMEGKAQTDLLRDLFGNPFRPVILEPSWLTAKVVALAQQIYDSRAFDRLPLLANALEEAGCENTEILAHCRAPGPHIRGCWAVDAVLGKD
jgi:hypothetical protein